MTGQGRISNKRALIQNLN